MVVFYSCCINIFKIIKTVARHFRESGNLILLLIKHVMKIIDSHQHFWKYNSKDFDWITDEMSVIRKDFLPEELQSIYKDNNVEGCIAVQVNQTEKENNFFLDLANQFDFIKGVVGWTDLMAN